MKHGFWLTSFALLVLFLASGRSLPCPQDSRPKEKAKENKIEGFWTQIYSETDGDSSPSMMNLGPLRLPPGGMPGRANFGMPPTEFIWKFSKEVADSGWDDARFPHFRSRYQMDPGNKIGVIDMLALDKDGERIEQRELKGIYLLKDDILMICYTYAKDGPRPERFTTSAKSRARLVVLRRGKVKTP